MQITTHVKTSNDLDQYSDANDLEAMVLLCCLSALRGRVKHTCGRLEPCRLEPLRGSDFSRLLRFVLCLRFSLMHSAG